ncbi:MAG: hypothetical protein L6V88_04355 [Anaerotruncus sp.]|nr:MAG: hypothetical protein L6V88_04355 [Anaerotruncus sp.]
MFRVLLIFLDDIRDSVDEYNEKKIPIQPLILIIKKEQFEKLDLFAFCRMF